MVKIFVVFLLFFLSLFPTSISAGNPVIKDRFSADPAALVHDDKVYLYVGRDQAGYPGQIHHFYVLKEWNVYSSRDMKTWELEGSLPRTEFSWAREDTAWAAQAIERDGKFYWYVTVLNRDSDPDKNGFAIGVAVSDHPASGFKDAIGAPLVRSDMTEAPGFMDPKQTWDNIDPTVFIDDNGQAYLYWGNTHLYYAKLKDNMIELDGEIHQLTIENMPGTFTEAPYLHKYKDTYYLSFAMNFPEVTAYATSHSPEGPWQYQGILLDRMDDSETSHQAIIEFKGDWYLIYHTGALPGGGNFRRSTSIDKLSYNEDGTIQKVTPTASGLAFDSYVIKSSSRPELGIRHLRGAIRVSSYNDESYDFQWHIVPGLANASEEYVSFQAENKPGYYLRFGGEFITLAKHDGSKSFSEAATFKVVRGLENGEGVSFQSYKQEELYLFHHETNTVRIGEVGSDDEKRLATFQIVALDGSLAEEFIPKLEATAVKRSFGTIFMFTSLVILVLSTVIFMRRRYVGERISNEN
ncbi:family 43 glycosylhydrolase [Anaerobacillus alkaliphilus]|uniref:family 43 glycosylhydrolase n=1 Tax=Anaerobacillus alkaliphilus TaxID=1548597 RepID=UPI0013757F13|nr:family 43 glycosylhydrolase [Anaerobacillus alkaliphilus]